MTGRHGRKPRVPFAAVVVLLVVLVGGALALANLGKGEAGAVDGAPAASSAPTEPPAASPSATPTPTPTAAAAEEPDERKGPLVIHGTGDVSLDPSYIPAFRTNGYGWAWSGLDGLFVHDDLTIVNHECPSTNLVAPVPKEFSFRCDPAALEAARAGGVDVLSFANNHAFDQGPQGLLDSLRNAKRADLIAVGAGESAEEADAPRYVEVKGWRIGIVGVDEVLDTISQVAVGDEVGTSVGHTFPRALRAIREAEANADLVVVMIHWGVELDTQPRDYQVQEAHAMIDAGADMIFGGHSHRLQPMETYEGRPIFYSLGNFVWPHFSEDGSTTGVAEVVVRPNGTIKGRLLPAYIVSDGHPVLR